VRSVAAPNPGVSPLCPKALSLYNVSFTKEKTSATLLRANTLLSFPQSGQLSPELKQSFSSEEKKAVWLAFWVCHCNRLCFPTCRPYGLFSRLPKRGDWTQSLHPLGSQL